MNTLDYNQLIELYKISVEEKLSNLKNHHDRIAFYTGFFTAIMTLVFGGLLYSKTWYHFLFLSVGPILIFFISRIANKAAIKTYHTYLETITICAKYEQLLGLTNVEKINVENKDQRDYYWQDEPIMVTRYLENRKIYLNSRDFINTTIVKGQLRIDTDSLYNIFQFIALVIFCSLIWLSISTYQ